MQRGFIPSQALLKSQDFRVRAAELEPAILYHFLEIVYGQAEIIVGFSRALPSLDRALPRLDRTQPCRQLYLAQRWPGRGRGRARDALSYLARLPLFL